jgi:hypothetical protein
MLTLLIPFIALLARVRAQAYDHPVQINFVIDNGEQAKDYTWEETTNTESGKPNEPTDVGDAYDVGHLMILGADNRPTFKWSNPNIDGGSSHSVSNSSVP